MKATVNIPDNLFRRVKARGALEDRSLRSFAIELFQNWLEAPPVSPRAEKNDHTPEEFAKYPWLAISKNFVNPDVSASMNQSPRLLDTSVLIRLLTRDPLLSSRPQPTSSIKGRNRGRGSS